MKNLNILMIISLLSIASCGNSDGGGSGQSQNEEYDNRSINEATSGTFYTVLRPVNFQANGFIPYGMAIFTLQNDDLQVNVSLDDDQAVSHRQALHIGSRCPKLSDDTNGDGFIDYEEALKVVGPAIMPLDSDLNSQMAGRDQFPKGRAMTYSRQASLSRINADLWVSDEDQTDDVVKLSNGKRIGFEGRVILVHGTSHQSFFPASLASYKNEPAHLSLPIVCGVLDKID
jgi:hypothetical protein